MQHFSVNQVLCDVQRCTGHDVMSTGDSPHRQFVLNLMNQAFELNSQFPNIIPTSCSQSIDNLNLSLGVVRLSEDYGQQVWSDFEILAFCVVAYHRQTVSGVCSYEHMDMSEFERIYPALPSRRKNEVEKESLLAFANWTRFLLQFVSGKPAKDFFMRLVPKLAGNFRSKFCTGGGESAETSDRVFIYRKEAGVEKRRSPRKPGLNSSRSSHAHRDDDDDDDEPAIVVARSSSRSRVTNDSPRNVTSTNSSMCVTNDDDDDRYDFDHQVSNLEDTCNAVDCGMCEDMSEFEMSDYADVLADDDVDDWINFF